MMEDWKEFIKGLGVDYRKGQDLFNQRTTNFLNSDHKVLLNPAGMGLGKTLATTKVIKDFANNYDFFFIANPTSPLKDVWANELNNIKLKDYMIWFAKKEMCIKKQEDSKFNESDCNDDCKYMTELWASKEPKQKCEELLSSIKLPTTPEKYYKSHGCINCLLPICRLGLKKRKILIGDFFGVLNSKMFNLVTRYNDVDRNKGNAVLIIDEAHLLPQRAKQFLSKQISFDRAIREIELETQCDYITRENLILMKPFKESLETLKLIKDNLIKKIDNPRENTIRYTYSDFVNDYNLFKLDQAFEFDKFKLGLLILAKEGHKYNIDSYENNDDPYCVKFWRFLNDWEIKENDKNYSKYFQYSIKTNNRIKLFINCQDTSEFLSEKLSMWNKVILNSGTISDLDYFKHNSGIENLEVKYEDLLESYSIKDDVIIYPIGNFISRNRKTTYELNKPLIQDVLKNLSNRTIIYIQSKKDSVELEKQIKELNIPCVNFCIKDDGFETSKEDFNNCMTKFNNLSYGIALMNINGRVEGYNFKNEEDNSSVSNIIIYGYPFPRRGLVYDDELKYLENITKDYQLARKWMDYVPTLDKIHQACMRSKRSEKDKPIIILWDNQFGKGERGYKFMPQDLRGEFVYEKEQLINLVIQKNGNR